MIRYDRVDRVLEGGKGNRGDTHWALNDWSQGLHLPTAAPFRESTIFIFMNKFEAQNSSGFIYRQKYKSNFLFHFTEQIYLIKNVFLNRNLLVCLKLM